MAKLDVPDICAHLDRLKRLCDRLEKAQSDEERYGEITAQIRAETDALHAMICRYPPPMVSRPRMRA
jgi:branched-subunit amino acid aminotransferase/4-amino-4-deoxychorismate lyase